MKTYRIGICGYGNLGRGVELALRQQPDMTLAAVFTRRDPASLSILTPGASGAAALRPRRRTPREHRRS